MSKVKLLLIFGIFLFPLVFCGTQPYPKYYKNNKYRRVGLFRHDKKVGDKFFDALYNQNDFFDNLYNVKGKKHDMGADFSLTTPIYKHINPYYTKKVNNNENEEPKPVYYPVYNHQNNTHNSVQDGTATNEHSMTGYNYQAPPSNTEEKSNSYLPPSTSYGVPDTPYSSYGTSNNYGPPTNYGTPGTFENPIPFVNPTSHGTSPTGFGSSQIPSGYGAPQVPSSGYGQPNPSYNQPNPTYGPPQSAPTAPGTSSYYPNSYMPQPQYGPPTAMMETVQKGHEGFMEKIVKKFDLVLLSKMMLKLIIFKKIIKFIALICLLMFIPVLKKKFEESTATTTNEDEERKANIFDAYSNIDFRIKEVANFALSAIEGFESHDIRWCVGDSEFYCRLQYMLDIIDARYPGNKMLEKWFPNLVTTTEAPKTTTSSNYETKVIFNDYITESSHETSSIENVNED